MPIKLAQPQLGEVPPLDPYLCKISNYTSNRGYVLP